MTIVANIAWFSQAGYALAAVAVVSIVALCRPRISHGRRSTELAIGKLFRASMTDEAPPDKPER